MWVFICHHNPGNAWVFDNKYINIKLIIIEIKILRKQLKNVIKQIILTCLLRTCISNNRVQKYGLICHMALS